MPIPWSGDAAPYGFGPVAQGPSWLPQPAEWAALSVEAQTGDPNSTLELYRSALAIRRQRPELGAGDRVQWLDAPAGVLMFRRGDFVCTVNTTGQPVELMVPGTLLLSSVEDRQPGVLPADSTSWWAV